MGDPNDTLNKHKSRFDPKHFRFISVIIESAIMNDDKKKYGGNAIVEINNGKATKILKKNPSKEKIERFNREIEVLETIVKEENLSNIVEIISFDKSSEPCKIIMKACLGDSSDILNLTYGNVKKTIFLLKPIIETLQKLSERENPIYHRDLKPDNILYIHSKENPKLILSDFGCAIFKTDNVERLTQEFRGVGAMAYRAPEYHYGRVDEVNEKGDIFSVGKLLWYYVNGNKFEVFPYTLWFPEEYNLANRFPQLPEVKKLNLIIASTVHHNPKKRIGYNELLQRLTDLEENYSLLENEESKIKMTAFEEKLKIDIEENNAIFENLLEIVFEDIQTTLSRLLKEYGSAKLVSELDKSFDKKQPIEKIKNTLKANHEYPFWTYSIDKINIYSRIYQPSMAHQHMGNDIKIKQPYIYFQCEASNDKGDNMHFSLCWFYEFGMNQFISDKGKSQKLLYNKDQFHNHLQRIIEFIIT